jgi:hypothetical protein
MCISNEMLWAIGGLCIGGGIVAIAATLFMIYVARLGKKQVTKDATN